MCIDEQTLLKLLADELPEDQRHAALAHLAQCPACQQLHDSLRQTWEELGQWQVSPPATDLTQRILAAAQRPSIQGRRYGLARIAAAIVLAGGVGWTAGRLGAPANPASSPVPTEEMARSIGLDALGEDVSAFSAVFPDPADAEGPSSSGGRS